MYIVSNKRKNNTHHGPSLDYLGRPVPPSSPSKDPYWTLRVDFVSIKDTEKDDGQHEIEETDVPKPQHKLYPNISQKPKYAPDYVWPGEENNGGIEK